MHPTYGGGRKNSGSSNSHRLPRENRRVGKNLHTHNGEEIVCQEVNRDEK